MVTESPRVNLSEPVNIRANRNLGQDEEACHVHVFSLPLPHWASR
jgi:hypothetical protein